MEMNLDVKVVGSYLLRLPSFTCDSRSQNLTLLSAKKEKFEKAVDAIDIFIILEECTSFMNYHIYEHLISKFQIANEELRILSYPQRLWAYVEKHKISEYIQMHPSLKQYSDDTKDLVLVLDIETTCRLSKLLDLREVVAKVMDLDPSSLLLHDIKEHCVIVTFRIPTSVADVIFTGRPSKVFSQEQRGTFRNLLVQQLQCNGYEFDFTLDGPEVTSSKAATANVPGIK